MYGTRENLCLELERMFTDDEPLTLLIWTEEGVYTACREERPADSEIRALMKEIGSLPMDTYRRDGVTNDGVVKMLTRFREDERRQVCVPALLLSRVLSLYESELENLIGQAWEAGRTTPESVQHALNDVHNLQDLLAA